MSAPPPPEHPGGPGRPPGPPYPGPPTGGWQPPPRRPTSGWEKTLGIVIAVVLIGFALAPIVLAGVCVALMTPSG